MDQDGKRKRTVNAEGDILSGTLIFRPLEISRRVLSDYSGSRCMSRKKKFGISHSDERNLKSGAPLRCKPAAMLEDAEQWGSDKGVRGRFRDGGAREQEGWVLKLPNGRETRKRKGGFERARRVANRNEGPVCR